MPELFRLKVDIEGASVIQFEKKKLRSVLRQAGGEVAALARSMIRGSSGGGRVYSVRQRGAILGHTASAPGQPPSSRTGALSGSIRVRAGRGGDAVSVIASQFYAKFLETGAHGGGPGRRSRRVQRGGIRTAYARSTRVMEPRPFLSAALDARHASIEARIRAAIVDGVAFKREPVR